MRSTARFWPLLALGFMLAFVSGCSFRPLLTGCQRATRRHQPQRRRRHRRHQHPLTLGRSANVSIYFENEQDERFYFRDSQLRSPGDYGVAWGGGVNESLMVNDGFGPQQVMSRVLPDGAYTWTVEATDERGNVETQSGTITLHDGDTVLPELQNFTVVPQEFRPNQDGLRDDWVSISYYLPKDVDNVQVYLIDPAEPNLKYPIAESERVIKPGELGFHEYRYEGGVDLGAEPPPDGTYIIYGDARDLAGNQWLSRPL
ncbi:MAG: hypothetical protein M9927_00625 [Anaerolineae bacterium]|nr:hypothetical protein [Anaerolineae bacterium]